VRDSLSAGSLTICNTTDSTNCTTGAVVIAGGLGVSRAINACGVINTTQRYQKNGATILDAAASNTSVGLGAGLVANASGNTFVGLSAGAATSTGNGNTAQGALALTANTTGSNNSAFGNSALGSNTTGGLNTAVGQFALPANTTGSSNTAAGQQALFNVQGGSSNTGLGIFSGSGIVSGTGNTFLGALTSASGDFNNSIALGVGAQVNASSQLAIGSSAQPVGPITTTPATAGVAAALPALPVGYFSVRINGTNYKIPLYLP
jgi:hypothetical protein